MQVSICISNTAHPEEQISIPSLSRAAKLHMQMEHITPLDQLKSF